MPRKTKAVESSPAETAWMMEDRISAFDVLVGRLSEPIPQESCGHPWHSRPASAAQRRKNSGHDYHTWRAGEELHTPAYCKECSDKHWGGNTVYCPACGCNNLGGGSPDRSADITISERQLPLVSTLSPELIEAELEEANLKSESDDSGSDLNCYRYFALGVSVRHPEDRISDVEEQAIITQERRKTYLTGKTVAVDPYSACFTGTKDELLQLDAVSCNDTYSEGEHDDE